MSQDYNQVLRRMSTTSSLPSMGHVDWHHLTQATCIAYDKLRHECHRLLERKHAALAALRCAALVTPAQHGREACWMYSAEHSLAVPVLQGIMQIGVMFTQISTLTFSLALVQILEAAVKWPKIAVIAAIGCAVLAGIRTAALALVMAKYTPGSGKAAMAIMGMREGKKTSMPLLDRAALLTVGGLLLPFSVPMDNPVSQSVSHLSSSRL